MSNDTRERLIEAAARAMYAHDEQIDQEANKAHMEYWFDHPGENDRMIGDEYRGSATVALDAILAGLMVPDEGMVQAGANMTDDDDDARKERASGVWWAMLKTLEAGK